MARQDSRHSGPGEGRADTKHGYSLKLAQLRWTVHVIGMTDGRLPNKVFYRELQKGSPEVTIQRHPQSLFNGFRNGIKLGTGLKMYKAVVLPTLLYACETWTVYQRHAKRLSHFHLSCLRKLLKIKWQDKILDTEVLKKAGMQSMYTVYKLAQLR